jgi:hypothetical protein
MGVFLNQNFGDANMQQDRLSRMEDLALEIANQPKQLDKNLGPLLVLLIQEVQDQRKKMIELEDRQANVEDARNEHSALRDQVEEYGYLPCWNGEDIRSVADYRDMDEEDY